MNKIINYILFIIIIIFIIKLLKSNYNLHFENNTYTLPKIVWSYWNVDTFDKIPLSVKQILIDRNKKMESKGWKVNIINNVNIDDYIKKEDYPDNYYLLSVQAQSDWIRLKLLNQYGGLWLDASIIINDINFLENIYNQSLINKSELIGYYLDGRTSNNDPQTFIESWFIMAPLKSNIIKKWLQEFEYAINISFDEYLNNVRETGYENWGIFEFGTYLMIHLCLQIVLQKMKNPNILLFKAENDMFKIQSECKWDIECIHNKLLKDKTTKDIPFIKLRGGDRVDDMKDYYDL